MRGRAQRTQQAYVGYVAELAKWYHRAPDLITYDEVVTWLHHLIKERKLAASSVNIAVNAVRFLYAVTLGRDTAPLLAQVPRMKRDTKRAHAYAVSEIEAILRAPLRLRDRAFLMTVYSAGLVRIRHYGILANNRRARDIALARDLLSHPPGSRASQDKVAQAILSLPAFEPMRCPVCQQATLQLCGFLDRHGKFHPRRPKPAIQDST